MKAETSAATAYPLSWPDGWSRTRSRRSSNFKVTGFGKVRDEVLTSLRLMGAKSVVLSSNLALRRDGLPYANMPNPEDPGIAVYWYDFRKEQHRSMACDRWVLAIDNLRAVGLSLEALRGLDRWGSSEIVERAFSGFTALPAPATGWRAVFDVRHDATFAEVKEIYRSMASFRHPDKGGSVSAMIEINDALAAAKAELL